MEFTWIAIGASLLMGVGAVLIFVFSVKQEYFQDLEDAKYQVFWSDLEDLVDNANNQQSNPSQNNPEIPSSTHIINEMESDNGNQENS